MISLRLLADDLTGALDTAAELVAIAGPVHAYWHASIPSALMGSAALDSGTREMQAGAAIERVMALTPALTGSGLAFKKIDSLMRGPTLAEAAACFRSGEWTHAIVAPAFPYQGRITRNGVQHVRDATGAWTPVGGDIIQRLRVEAASAQAGHLDREPAPGISVFDAETDDDLNRIAALGKQIAGPVLWIGTGGLAAALAGRAPAHPAGHRDLCLQPPVLGLFGSDQAVTAGQLAACGADWLKLPDGGPASSRAVAAQLETRGKALISVDLPGGLSRSDAASRIEVQLHRLARELPAPGTLVVAGGETLRGLCLCLGATSLEVQGRVVPGLPRSVMRGGRWDGVTVLSKSGAFGPPALLRDLMRSTLPIPERMA